MFRSYRLVNWRVSRSGNGMTAYGEDAESRNAIKITCIKRIEPSRSYCLATDVNDVKHRLLLR